MKGNFQECLTALEGLIRLRQQDSFTISEQSNEALEEWRSDVDPVKQFAEDFFVEKDGSMIRLKAATQTMNEWAVSNNLQSKFSLQGLRKRLGDLGYSFDRTHEGWVLKGYHINYEKLGEDDLNESTSQRVTKLRAV